MKFLLKKGIKVTTIYVCKTGLMVKCRYCIVQFRIRIYECLSVFNSSARMSMLKDG